MEQTQPTKKVVDGKRRRLADGVYIKGSINGERVTFTMDTGASHTIISKRVFNRIPDDLRPKLVKTSSLIGAGGAPINELGKAEFELILGPLELQKDVIVADIEDDALLGFDILGRGNVGPADILLSRNEIVLNGVSIPVFQVGRTEKSRQVTLADDVSVPGQAEAIVDVYIERFEGDDDEESDYVVEPADAFCDRYPLKLASTLININQSPTCKVRVMNPFPAEVKLRQNAIIGRAEKIERIISVIKDAEHEEVDDLNSVRRIQIAKRKAEEVKGPPRAAANKRDVPDHLKDMYEKSIKGKSEMEAEVVAGLLVKFQEVFSKSEWDIGLTHLAEHSIDTGDAKPVKQRPRRVPLAYAEEEKRAIEDLLQKGVIRKSNSPWASPIVLVKKKSGAIRPCVDYRRVNTLIKQDGFPLPRVQDCLDAVAGSAYFSSLDLTSGYFQIPLKEDDIPKSAFCCKYGLYEMTRMPFGLSNSCGTFQRTMELALQGLQWETCLVYIDDIIVYGKDFDEHMIRVEQVLERIKQAGLKLKPEKCNFLQEQVVFLGHVVSRDGVQPDPTNVSKIVNWPRPENPKHVKQFVATGSYYRRFIRDFATTARPLIDLTKKDSQFLWNDECEEAFNAIKNALIGPEVMGYPLNDGGCFYLDTDASGYGIGGVLSQTQSDRERVIAYASRSMSKAEKNYCINEKELLAVVFFMQYFRQYLLGRRFIVRTDHQALVWLLSLKEPNGKIARWIEALAPFDYAIEYRAGKLMGHVDGLSRCSNPKDCSCSEVDMNEPLKCGPCRKCRRRAEQMMHPASEQVEVTEAADDTAKEPNSESPRETNSSAEEYSEGIRAARPEKPSCSGLQTSTSRENRVWFQTETTESLIAKQMQDTNIAPILKAKMEGNKPTSKDMEAEAPETRHYWVIWDTLHLRDGVLYRDRPRRCGEQEVKQVVVPRDLRKQMLSMSHDSVTSGHFGVKRTKARLLQSAYWFNMKNDVKWHITKCDTCAADKVPAKAPKAPLGHLTSGAPWDTLALDYLGPFPRTPRGNKYILVMTDPFTKYVEVIAVPNQQAEDCASRIMNDVVSRWGTPLRIHSDQGAAFESRVFRELCKMLDVRKTRTSPRNPKGNGQTERFNRTLLRMIRAYLVHEQEDWDMYLGCLAGAYRSTPNESTRMTPNLLSLGREVRLPGDVMCQPELAKVDDSVDHCEYVEELRDRMVVAHEIARRHLQAAAKRSKEVYDTKVVQTSYKPGDLVWCRHELRKPGVSPKLEKRYSGPFVVTARRSPINFVIQLNKDGTEKLVHHDKLKKYEGDKPEMWASKLSKKLKKANPSN